MTDSATGRTTTYYYDFTNRLMRYVESGTNYDHSVGYTYNTLNQLTDLTEIIDGVTHTTHYTYDDDGRISTLTNDSAPLTYNYDSYGRIGMVQLQAAESWRRITHLSHWVPENLLKVFLAILTDTQVCMLPMDSWERYPTMWRDSLRVRATG